MKDVRKEIWIDTRTATDKFVETVPDNIHEKVRIRVWRQTYYLFSYDVIDQIRTQIRDDLK